MTRSIDACERAEVRRVLRLSSGLLGLVFLGSLITGEQALAWIGSLGSLLAAVLTTVALRLRGGGSVYLNAQTFTFGLVGAAALPAAAWGGAPGGALIAVLAVFLGLAATTSFCVGRFLYLILQHATGRAG